MVAHLVPPATKAASFRETRCVVRAGVTPSVLAYARNPLPQGSDIPPSAPSSNCLSQRAVLAHEVAVPRLLRDALLEDPAVAPAVRAMDQLPRSGSTCARRGPLQAWHTSIPRVDRRNVPTILDRCSRAAAEANLGMLPARAAPIPTVPCSPKESPAVDRCRKQPPGLPVRASPWPLQRTRNTRPRPQVKASPGPWPARRSLKRLGHPERIQPAGG